MNRQPIGVFFLFFFPSFFLYPSPLFSGHRTLEPPKTKTRATNRKLSHLFSWPQQKLAIHAASQDGAGERGRGRGRKRLRWVHGQGRGAWAANVLWGGKEGKEEAKSPPSGSDSPSPAAKRCVAQDSPSLSAISPPPSQIHCHRNNNTINNFTYFAHANSSSEFIPPIFPQPPQTTNTTQIWE